MFKDFGCFLDSFLAMGIPGYDICVFKDGKEIFRQFKGFSDREKRLPMNGKERYNLYSCSKLITCAAALQLLEKGLYRLDDELAQYMPEFEKMKVRQPDGLVVPAKHKITIRHLFTMTAGFNYNLSAPSLRQCVDDTHGACPTRVVMRYLAEEPLDFEPGDHWQYSLCHDVLAALVEVVSGMNFNDYVKKNIFDPLGMTHSTFLLPCTEFPTIAAQYSRSGFDLHISRIPETNGYRIGMDYASGGAGCVSTVEDYIRFTEALRAGDVILGKETIHQMASPQLTPAQEETFWVKDDYSYGLGVRCPKENGTCCDFGWGGAAGAYTGIDLKHNMSFFFAEHVLNQPNHLERYQLPCRLAEIFDR